MLFFAVGIPHFENGFRDNKNPDRIGAFAEHIFYMFPLWWWRMDSNHRSHRQQIYSLPPLTTRELHHMNMNSGQNLLELVDGLEPPTC